MTDTLKLLPCPFCGQEAKMAGGPRLAPEWWARCPNCKAGTEGFSSLERASAAWNRRDLGVAELVGALEKVAAEAFVSIADLPDYDQPNGWRKVAVERIDIARAALAKFTGDKA